MNKAQFKYKDRIALSENTTYRGMIVSVQPSALVGDLETYSVRWDGINCEFIYLREALIYESEAKRQVK